jgi:glycerol kinase
VKQNNDDKKYIIGIDQGTTGTTLALIDAGNFDIIDKVSNDITQYFPHPGEVEHDLNEIWLNIGTLTTKLLAKNHVSPQTISCIGITNQRETTCAFDEFGTPIAKAIVWQDRRTHDYCLSLKEKEARKEIPNMQKKTGLTLDPYFSASKMNWFLYHSPEVLNFKKNTSKNFYLTTVDSFILYKLTGTKILATDSTNASRTLLMNIETGDWDPELLNIFEVPIKYLPKIQDSFGIFGVTKGLNFLPDGIPISGILGDQQSALFGQGCVEEGNIKCTYGTGAFALINTGRNLKYSRHGLLTTVAFQYQGQRFYALEGSCYIAGALIQWLRDQLKIIDKSSEVEELARKVENFQGMENVLLFPFFTGIGSPHWKSEAKATLTGLTRDTNINHIALAALEGITLSVNDLLEVFKSDSGKKISEIYVDGGVVQSQLLCQIQSNISQMNIIRPQITETTVYGAALAAAMGIHLITLDKVKNYWKEEKRFIESAEQKDTEYFSQKKQLWKKLLKKFYYD